MGVLAGWRRIVSMTLLALCKAASHFRDPTRLPGSAFYFLMSRAQSEGSEEFATLRRLLEDP